MERIPTKNIIISRCLLIIAILILLLGDIVTVNAKPDKQEKGTIVKKQETDIPVPYVTLRNRTGSSELSNYYGGSRGQLRAGICTASFSPIWGLDGIARSVPF